MIEITEKDVGREVVLRGGSTTKIKQIVKGIVYLENDRVVFDYNGKGYAGEKESIYDVISFVDEKKLPQSKQLRDEYLAFIYNRFQDLMVDDQWEKAREMMDEYNRVLGEEYERYSDIEGNVIEISRF